MVLRIAIALCVVSLGTSDVARTATDLSKLKLGSHSRSLDETYSRKTKEVTRHNIL